MKLKIVGDGTARNTRIVNEETGEAIENCERLAYVIETRRGHPDFNDRLATVTLTLCGVPIEATAEHVTIADAEE